MLVIAFKILIEYCISINRTEELREAIMPDT